MHQDKHNPFFFFSMNFVSWGKYALQRLQLKYSSYTYKNISPLGNLTISGGFLESDEILMEV